MMVRVPGTVAEGLAALGMTYEQAGIERKAKMPPKRRDLADTFEQLWLRFGPHEKYPMVREYKFCPSRKWRFDAAWPKYDVAVELEGGVWSRGRHTRPAGYQKDIEKYNTATALGYRVLRFTANDLEQSPMQTIEQVVSLLDVIYKWRD
jgi:very-short-patch-repair endonuclease